MHGICAGFEVRYSSCCKCWFDVEISCLVDLFVFEDDVGLVMRKFCAGIFFTLPEEF